MVSSAQRAQPAALGSPTTPGSAGLTSQDAAAQLRAVGPNAIRGAERRTLLAIAVAQFASPLIVILVIASLLSAATGDHVQAAIILIMVGLSAALGFVQEARSEAAVEALRQRLSARTTVIRDGAERDIEVEGVVPGDLVVLEAGDIVPADGHILDANHLFIDEAALTGESAPAAKSASPTQADGQDGQVFSGTTVVSGTARFTVTATGARSTYGTIARRLSEREPETDFQHGVRAFGLLIARVTLLLVVGVLVVNLAFNRPLVESLLFAIALAVGLTPELLPAVVTLNLSRGARALAGSGVLVKRLPAIQNLGSMTVLCTDKTGTLTEGRLRVERSVGPDGADSPDVLRLAYLNSRFQTGFRNPLDDAILASGAPTAGDEAVAKLAELPYDFERRCLSVLVGLRDGSAELVTKGAPDDVLARCSAVSAGAATNPVDDTERNRILDLIRQAGSEGYRAIGVATRPLPASSEIDAADERGLVFRGLLLLSDPPKADVGAVLARLAALEVDLKIVTGDDPLVATHVASQVGLHVEGVLTGDEIAALTHDALLARAQRTTIFARVNPDQKLRVIRALHERGSVVGYLGDGINDAPPLFAADVGISVDNATDVARAAADIVLLQPSLEAIARGVAEGRRTFANTLKYIRMGSSSNFGNMFSMAGSALLLPFLPMLPSQILLNNLIYDLSQTTIPSDGVDPEIEAEPARWDIRGIERFMVTFGPISSLFDFLTFGLLYVVLQADEPTFHTGWFVESLFTQVLVVLAIRTRRSPFWRSRPSRPLAASVFGAVTVAALLPLTPLAGPLGFVAPPIVFWPLLAVMVAVYLALVELVKRRVFGVVAAPRPAVDARA